MAHQRVIGLLAVALACDGASVADPCAESPSVNLAPLAAQILSTSDGELCEVYRLLCLFPDWGDVVFDVPPDPDSIEAGRRAAVDSAMRRLGSRARYAFVAYVLQTPSLYPEQHELWMRGRPPSAAVLGVPDETLPTSRPGFLPHPYVAARMLEYFPGSAALRDSVVLLLSQVVRDAGFIDHWNGPAIFWMTAGLGSGRQMGRARLPAIRAAVCAIRDAQVWPDSATAGVDVSFAGMALVGRLLFSLERLDAYWGRAETKAILRTWRRTDEVAWIRQHLVELLDGAE